MFLGREPTYLYRGVCLFHFEFDWVLHLLGGLKNPETVGGVERPSFFLVIFTFLFRRRFHHLVKWKQPGKQVFYVSFSQRKWHLQLLFSHALPPSEPYLRFFIVVFVFWFEKIKGFIGASVEKLCWPLLKLNCVHSYSCSSIPLRISEF